MRTLILFSLFILINLSRQTQCLLQQSANSSQLEATFASLPGASTAAATATAAPTTISTNLPTSQSNAANTTPCLDGSGQPAHHRSQAAADDLSAALAPINASGDTTKQNFRMPIVSEQIVEPIASPFVSSHNQRLYNTHSAKSNQIARAKADTNGRASQRIHIVAESPASSSLQYFNHASEELAPSSHWIPHRNTEQPHQQDSSAQLLPKDEPVYQSLTFSPQWNTHENVFGSSSQQQPETLLGYQGNDSSSTIVS